MARHIKEADSLDYKCCVDLARRCVGAECMAWVYDYGYSPEQEQIMRMRTGMAALMPLVPSKRLEIGSCGRVK